MKRIVIAAMGVALLCAAIVWSHWSAAPLPGTAQADHIVVEKHKHQLTLYAKGTALRTYAVALSRNPVGPKERVGDWRTPEGHFIIDHRNPKSEFHLSLHISYPTPADRARARALGYFPGGEVMIHGVTSRFAWLGRAQQLFDWTAGCIAVTNDQIEEIARVVPDGTPIEIRP
ncbi:MAG: L,D-transpeptidase family protein [Steroidobacteraceae bacterium]